jgi:hypothetical protein
MTDEELATKIEVFDDARASIPDIDTELGDVLAAASSELQRQTASQQATPPYFRFLTLALLQAISVRHDPDTKRSPEFSKLLADAISVLSAGREEMSGYLPTPLFSGLAEQIDHAERGTEPTPEDLGRWRAEDEVRVWDELRKSARR